MCFIHRGRQEVANTAPPFLISWKGTNTEQKNLNVFGTRNPTCHITHCFSSGLFPGNQCSSYHVEGRDRQQQFCPGKNQTSFSYSRPARCCHWVRRWACLRQGEGEKNAFSFSLGLHEHIASKTTCDCWLADGEDRGRCCQLKVFNKTTIPRVVFKTFSLGENSIHSIQQVGSGVWIPCLRYWRNLSGANVLFLFHLLISSFPYSVFFIVIFRYICFLRTWLPYLDQEWD